MMRLEDYGEDVVVGRLTRLLTIGNQVIVGPGDDCAVVAGPRRGEVSLLKTDCLVEGVHYTLEAPAEQVGWKSVARVVSDFAAMGGAPEHLLVTVALPPERDMGWAEKLYRGMNKCAVRFGASVVGGETSSVPRGAPGLISVAATGRARRKLLVLRSGGRPGDDLFVTGRLGGSLAGKHLRFLPRVEEALWLAQRFPLHAMMDLSDGLAKDLPRLAGASGCGYLLDEEAVPRTRGTGIREALGDGEDYELLVAVSKRTGRRMADNWAKRFPKLKLTRIGELRVGVAKTMDGGWEHFAER